MEKQIQRFPEVCTHFPRRFLSRIPSWISHHTRIWLWNGLANYELFFFLISPLGGITLHAQRGMPVKICHQTPTVSSPAEYILLSVLQWEENIIFFFFFLYPFIFYFHFFAELCECSIVIAQQLLNRVLLGCSLDDVKLLHSLQLIYFLSFCGFWDNPNAFNGRVAMRRWVGQQVQPGV